MATAPWDKALPDLSKFDWLTAVCHNSKHQKRTRDLRVAIALSRLADASTGIAWPTQQSLADLGGFADPRQVRSAIASLRGTGAIEVVRIGELSEETRATLALKRQSRGKAYRLRMFWASETLEGSNSPSSVRLEPAHLQFGKARKRITVVRSKRTTVVRSEQDHDSPPNMREDIQDIKAGAEGTVRLASTREGNSYALASGRAA